MELAVRVTGSFEPHTNVLVTSAVAVTLYTLTVPVTAPLSGQRASMVSPKSSNGVAVYLKVFSLESEARVATPVLLTIDAPVVMAVHSISGISTAYGNVTPTVTFLPAMSQTSLSTSDTAVMPML